MKYLSIFLSIVFGANLYADLTFEQRIEAQRKIEKVYYEKRIWPKENPKPKPKFEEIITEEILKKKVEDYIKKSILLEEIWGRPITGEQLQAEMDRMAKNTKDPETLKKLFEALGNDPYLIAECLARPILADRLIRNWYAFDERFHGELKKEAEELHKKLTIENFKTISSENYSEIIIDTSKYNSKQYKNEIFLNEEDLDYFLEEFPEEGQISPLIETTDFFEIKATYKKDKENKRIHAAIIKIEKKNFDCFFKEISKSLNTENFKATKNFSYNKEYFKKNLKNTIENSPNSWRAIVELVPRHGHTAIWTGTEVIIWGGTNNNDYLNDGLRYDPLTDTFQPISRINAPQGRVFHSAIWTGKQMIIWGGKISQNSSTNTGGIYDPISDSWIPTSSINAPSPAYKIPAIWTGEEMIVWPNSNPGKKLDPITNTWTSISTSNAPSERNGYSSIWTGDYMIIWGGCISDQCYNTGFKYHPKTNTWQQISSINAPSGRYLHTSIWTGEEMIVWGGTNDNIYMSTGGKYNLSNDSWTSINFINAPEARIEHTAVWTGTEMIVWGGYYYSGGEHYLSTGGKYNPSTDTWTLTSTINAPSGRRYHIGIWANNKMIIWGGETGYNNVTYTGGIYYPEEDVWFPTNTYESPRAGYYNGIWTGNEMILWNGPGDRSSKYYPSLDIWQKLNSENSPDARQDHTIVWTGEEMIIWGGYVNPGPGITNTGGKYNPSTDTWTATSTTNAPSGRYYHTAVWTGEEMIVWGGWDGTNRLNTGGRYNPITDAWTQTSTTNAPSGRYYHTAVWTGEEMIVWGGITNNGCNNTGGKHNPIYDNWMPINIDNAPTNRKYHTAVWTGQQMIIWGGHDCINNSLNTGAKYYPKVDIWQETNLEGAPNARHFHRAVWTGKEMIIWGGGYDNGSNYLSGGRYDPENDLWKETEIKNAPRQRYKHSMVWSGNEIIIYSGVDASEFLRNGGIYYPNTSPVANLSLKTSIGDDNIFILGQLEELNLDGSNSTDGSNPYTTIPNHDKLDSIVSYEWDLNGDADFGNNCQNSNYGIDRVGEISNLNQSELEQIGISIPGNYNIWLRVTDEVGEKDCASAILIVQDGAPPSVNVTTPNGGESWAYSESSENRQSHLIVWSSSDNFEISRTKISYTTDGTHWTCISDSESLDCPANGLAPSATNYLWQMPAQEEAQAQGQTFPSATCKIKIEVWDSSNNYSYDTSDSNFYIVQPTTTSIKTIILWNSERICNSYDQNPPDPSCDCLNAKEDLDCEKTYNLSRKLIELRDHQKVSGVIFDLSDNPDIKNAYSLWDSEPLNISKANDVASSIRNYILSQINNTYTNTQFIILAGDDNQIPFYRMADGTTIYPESNYITEVGLSTSNPLGYALSQNYFLTDNYYSELEPENSGMPSPHNLIYQNDFAIGRLVEKPEQIEFLINTFLAQNGQVNAMPDTGNPKKNRVLITGFDFLYDSAKKIWQDYDHNGYTPDGDLDQLLDNPAPGQTGDEYSPSDLEEQIFPTTPNEIPHWISNINTHANHFSYATSIPEGTEDNLYCTVPSYNLTKCYSNGIDSNLKELKGTVIYTSGCHSGLVVPEGDEKPLDLSEEVAKKGVVGYIANTGYGWGLKHGRGLTETLMEEITNEILNSGSIAIGKALANAKRNYTLKEKRWDVFDEKVMHELTLFGIPNYLVKTAQEGFAPKKDEELPPPDSKEDKACVKGICMEKKLWTREEKGLLPPGVTQLDLNFTFGPETYQKITTPDGDYYTLNGRASGETGDAIQPNFIYNSYLSGTKAHGIIFVGGNYSEESPFDPVIAVPRSTNTDNGEGPLPASPTFVPGVRVSFGVSSPSTLRGIGQVGYTNMLVYTGYYSNNVESRFQDMQFTIYYSNSSDITAPEITDPGSNGFHTLQGLEATFNATITDASGVYRAVIIYNDKRTGRWESFDLQKGNGDNWSGKITLKGNITYYLQAIDNAGNVGIISITGQDLDGNNQPYGSTWSGPKVWEITLTDTDSDQMPDAYEEQYYCLNKNLNDANQDPDYDYLTNINEFSFDTNPCKGDTDGGGDNDGSEKNNGRDNLNKTDDKHLTIMVTKNGSNYTIDWDDSYGENSLIDGYYFVYRSDTPFFDATDKINPAPIPDGTTSYVDSNPPCSICYYNVWNYQIDTQPLIVEAVVPATGPSSGGTSVKVYGENFQQGAKVYFDNVMATNIVFVNESQINCKTPPHPAGAVDVKVVNPNGQEGVLSGGFTYQ